MKQLVLIIMLLVCFGCDSKYIHNANDLIMMAKAKEYLETIYEKPY